MDRKRILSYINLSLLGITIILFVLAKTTTSKQLTGIALIIEVTIQLTALKNKKDDEEKIIYYSKTKESNITIYEEEREEKKYHKKRIQTETEINFYKQLKEIVPEEKYTLQAQIPLSAIVYKSEEYNYRSELFRTIDYGIFDKKGDIIVTIELNDRSHLREERKERDRKVKKILEEADIPLITIWVYEKEKIKEELKKYIEVKE